MEKVLLLLSGGIDSPVAGYIMKKKGFEVVALHFSNKFVGNEPKEKAKKISKKLGFKKIIVIDITKGLEEIVKKCKRKYYFILMKILMYKLAEKIAKKEKCKYLVTGENLGQVSSQTLQNLYIINKAISIPVLRPLIAYDKMEIVELAKKIGTFEISRGPEMCDVLGPKHAATRVEEEVILSEEEKIKIKKLVLQLLSQNLLQH